MIQDIYPHKLNNQYDPAAKPSAEDQVMFLRDREILVKLDGEITFPKVKELKNVPAEELIYLFSVDEERYFLCRTAEPEEAVDASCGYEMRNMMTLREGKLPPKYRVFAAMTAKHLNDWYRDTAFCGRCGAKTEHSKTERARVCPSCGYTAYPRIMPACIIGVMNGDKLLITKYRRGYGHSALIAGFTEIGETLEETVAREVMEEAGVKVKNIRYYKSQPWGMPNDILAGFYCELDGDPEIHMDDNELKFAQWTSREDIVLQPDDSSLTNEMMKNFKEGIVGVK